MRCNSPFIRIQSVISIPVSAEMARPEETAESLCYRGSWGRQDGSHRRRAGRLSSGHSPLSPTAWFSGKPPWDVLLSFPLLFCVLTSRHLFWFFSGCGHMGCMVNTHKLGFGDRTRMYTYSTGLESSIAFCLFRTFSEPTSTI